MAEGTAGGKTEGPGTKGCRMAQISKVLDDDQRDLLEHVVGVGRTDQGRDERAKGPVDTAKQQLQRVPVATLGEGDEERLASVRAFGHLFI
jgi:hypothetical protein